MLVNTFELNGRALDAAVAIALGNTVKIRTWKDITDTLDPIEDKDAIDFHRENNTIRVSFVCKVSGAVFPCPEFSTSWTQGGPIIDREFIYLSGWRTYNKDFRVANIVTANHTYSSTGPTSLIAAMRCFVAYKLGDTVDIPEELINA